MKKRGYLRLASLSFLSLGVAGCFDCGSNSCEGDDFVIAIDENSEPAIPDQAHDGYYFTSVQRTFANEDERHLILRAEAAASTIGTTWYDQTQGLYGGPLDPSSPNQLLLPVAVNGEALLYYAKRLQRSQTAGCPDGYIYLSYSAIIELGADGQPVDGPGTKTVLLELNYGEGTTCGPLQSGGGPTTSREIVFDEHGEIIDIRGDGEASVIVA